MQPRRGARRSYRRSRRSTRGRQRTGPWGRIVRYAANAGVVVITALAGLAGLVAFFARDLPDTDSLWASQRAPRVTLLALDGAPLIVHGESAGKPVRLSELPQHVPQSVLAVEDRNFYHHVGVNPVSVVRALLVNAEAGKVRQGASTITQQLAKNIFLSPDRTLKRKIQELLLALWLEHRFTKDEILTLYLNRVYFGAGAYGVDAASYKYFGKPARLLEVGEAAVLAGLLKAPSRYAPTNNPDSAGKRGRLVLDAMVAARFLTEAEAGQARATPIILSSSQFAAAPYFVDFIMQEVRLHAQSVDADLIVQTTYDPKLQAALQSGLLAGRRLSPLPDDVQTAAVIVDAQGAVRAMIGGRDYRASQFNRAVQARRQPGSAFKPFVFLAALEAGYKPADRVQDAPIAIDNWRPDNYGGQYFGEVTLTTALARSLNGATIRVQETVGRSAVRIVARRMGLEATKTRGPSLALGVDAVSPLELAGAYAPLANGGFQTGVHVIDSIRTNEGQTVYRRQAAMIDTAASFRSVDQLNGMLREVVRSGTGRAAAIPGAKVAGKTGTTQGNRDAWFAGHVNGLVGVVWVGRDDNKPMSSSITGGGAPAVIWREALRRAIPASTPRSLQAPDPDTTQSEDPLAVLLQERV